MQLWLFVDISLHLLFSSCYGLYYLQRHKWGKKYYFCSFLIFSMGFFVDLDHRQFIKDFFEKITKGRLVISVPAKVDHLCHSWRFALSTLVVCAIIFIVGYRDFSLLSLVSYATHMGIDSLKKPGPNPNNALPTMIHKFFSK